MKHWYLILFTLLLASCTTVEPIEELENATVELPNNYSFVGTIDGEAVEWVVDGEDCRDTYGFSYTLGEDEGEHSFTIRKTSGDNAGVIRLETPELIDGNAETIHDYLELRTHNTCNYDTDVRFTYRAIDEQLQRFTDCENQTGELSIVHVSELVRTSDNTQQFDLMVEIDAQVALHDGTGAIHIVGVFYVSAPIYNE